jgi:type IV pilus assembly protein PilW
MKTAQLLSRRSKRVHGLSLVELMIALVLGLLVTGGAIGMFLSNRQAYSATESLGRVQENSRLAFELMARDIREAAGNPCSSNLPVANVVTPQTWLSSWNNGIIGYENGALGVSAAGTDAIEVKSGGSSGISVTHNLVTTTFTAVSGGTAFKSGDLALVCDYRQATIFVVASATATEIKYNTGVPTPARADGAVNCAVGLGYPNPCTTARTYGFQPSTIITKLRAVRWYVANNGRGAGRSLYQAVDNAPAQEIVEGVRDMEIGYLVKGTADYVDASTVANWPLVDAVRITLNMEGGEGQERVGTDTAALRRELFHVVTLRNHNS